MRHQHSTAHQAVRWAFEAQATHGHTQSQFSLIRDSHGGVRSYSELDYLAQATMILSAAQRACEPQDWLLIVATYSQEEAERRAAAINCYELAQPDEIGQGTAAELVWEFARAFLPEGQRIRQRMLCGDKWNVDRVAQEIGYPRNAFRTATQMICGDLQRRHDQAMALIDAVLVCRGVVRRESMASELMREVA